MFRETPWPTRTDEGWRRTDISGIPFDEILATWGRASQARPTSPSGAHHGGIAPPAMDAPKPAGSPTGGLGLPEEAARQGVILTDLAEALERHADLLMEPFRRFPDDEVDRKFIALNRALWTEGVFLYVPRGVEVALPLHVQATFGAGRLVAPRLLMVVADGGKVTLLDEHVSPDFTEPVLAVGTADLFLGQGTEVRYVFLNRWGSNVNHFHHIRSEVGRDGRLTSVTIALGSSLTKATNEAVLVGEGANSDMLGLVFGKGKQHFEHHTTQHHRVAHTTSDLLVKVAVTDESDSVYSGMIRIDPHAQQANAYQTNQNILLSKKSHADTIPNLEILANDVRCSHGATVAPLDEEQIFYMRSRGIPEAEGKRLIVQGFLEQLLDRADLGELDGYVRARASEVIEKGFA